MSPGETVAFFVIFGGGFWVIRPVAAALAKRIAGEHHRPGIDPADHEQLRDELEQVKREMAELSERVDFTERVLAKQREPGALGPGRGS